MPDVRVPALDLRAQFREVESDVRAAIDRVLASQQFILGIEVLELEREAAAYLGAGHAVGVSSGTDAILLGLMALGVGAGDVVLTTPYTFVATVTSIARLGARAAFVDIDPETYALDGRRVASMLASGLRPRAIVPVHLFGQMADMDVIHAVARAHDVPVLEDAAQAIGAMHCELPIGRGSRGAALSFFPSKNLGCMGDGGMIVTDDADFAARLRLLRNHGQEPRHTCQAIGGNFRLDELQAAILRAKLPRLDAWTQGRRRVAALYRRLFGERVSGAMRAGELHLPREPANAHHVYNQFVVRSPRRDALRAHLEMQGVATAVYYPVPMHLQPAFRSWGHGAGDFPEAERAARESLALPIYPELADDAVAYVVDAVVGFFSAEE